METTYEMELERIVHQNVQRAECPAMASPAADQELRQELKDLKAEKIPRPATKVEYVALLARLEKEIADIAARNKQASEETAAARKAIDEKYVADFAAAKKDETNQWAAIRAVRNALLAACDWTQIPDVPLDDKQRKAWQAYRQALRDIPQQLGDGKPASPDDVVWPDKPVSP